MSDVIQFINGSRPNEGSAVIRATVGGQYTTLTNNLTDNPVQMSGYLSTRFDETRYYTGDTEL